MSSRAIGITLERMVTVARRRLMAGTITAFAASQPGVIASVRGETRAAMRPHTGNGGGGAFGRPAGFGRIVLELLQ